jgi:hypothetical protein
MKKMIILPGILLVAFNSLALLFFDGYKLHTKLLVDFSIISSLSAIYIVSNSKCVDAYKISIAFICTIFSFIKCFASILFGHPFFGNVPFILIFGLTLVEVVSIIIIEYMSKHAKS